jgi:hypothetical protein
MRFWKVNYQQILISKLKGGIAAWKQKRETEKSASLFYLLT